jgi:hypothetical protein
VLAVVRVASDVPHSGQIVGQPGQRSSMSTSTLFDEAVPAEGELAHDLDPAAPSVLGVVPAWSALARAGRLPPPGTRNLPVSRFLGLT